MKKVAAILIAGLFVGLAVSGCASYRTVNADALVFDASTKWTEVQPTHSSRRLQFRAPSPHAGYEDAHVAVWNFPGVRDPGDGSIIRKNMVRWCDQFAQGDGTPSQEVATTAEYRINGLPVHTIDISGRYVARISPRSRLTHNKGAYRMLGAYIVSPQGDYIVQLIGPRPVVAAYAGVFDDFVSSVRMGDGSFIPRNASPGGRPRAQLTAHKP